MELSLFGFTAALIIGLTLGLLGGGGSILTIPVLVYVFHFPPLEATAYSLFIVGVSSFAGFLSYWRKGLLSWQTALVFSLPAFVAVFLTRRFLLPGLPETLISWGRYDITADLVFASVLAAGILVTGLLILRYGIPGQTGRVFLLMTPAGAGIFVVRQYVLPALPEHWIELSGLTITRDGLILGVFALVMAGAGWAMANRAPTEVVTCSPGMEEDSALPSTKSMGWLLGQGAIVGLLTGFVGAGGGFLILPALALGAGLPMKTAVGTSLLIITVNSLIGFLGDWSLHATQARSFDWRFLLEFTGFALIGIFAGTRLVDRAPADALRRVFGWLVLALAVGMAGIELWRAWG
jgi:uncharacterized membrane protein YfcA